MEETIFDKSDRWLDGEGPTREVAVSCRARLARNLDCLPFPPRARSETLRRVAERVEQAVADSEPLADLYLLRVDAFTKSDRLALRESQVISQEMERGGEHRLVYLGCDPVTTIMVNEEDHLRMFVMLPGMQMSNALARVTEIEEELSQRLEFAFSEPFGYLTACPSNTGTGLRVSVMLHLPALALTEEVEAIMRHIPDRGMAVRGYYGENSAHMGDFYQLSNETTLGETEEQIVARLDDVISQVIAKETQARDRLFSKRRAMVEDKVYRAVSVLSSSRIITTQEAVQLLSLLRLGVDRGLFKGLTHGALNQLMVRVQPGHLQRAKGAPLTPDRRDQARADLLRRVFADVAMTN